MRINNDCARKILLEVEKIPFRSTRTVLEIGESLSEYAIEDIMWAITIFNRERIVVLTDRQGYDDNEVLRDNQVKCLTERGYRYLDLVRNDEIWNLMKEKLPNFNELSFFTLLNTASKLMNNHINKTFDLPDTSIIDYSRW